VATTAGAALAVLVSIRVAPDVPGDLSSAAVRSCVAALGEGRCELESVPSVPSEFHAVVTSTSSDLEEARVELRHGDEKTPVETRELKFATEDAPRERWASVGVLIAALVVARSREPEAPPPPRPPVKPAQALPREKVLRAVPAPVSLRIDARAFVARRTGGSSPEWGGALGASMLPRDSPWFGAFSIGAARRFGEVTKLDWLSSTLGVGFRLGGPAARVAAELRAAAVGEYWLLGASEPGRSEHEGRFRAGGLLGADALLALTQSWILSVGVQGLWVEPRLRVEVEGHVMERIPEYGALFLAGLRFVP